MFGKNLFIFATLAVYVAAVPIVDYVCIPYDDGSVPQYYPHESDCNRFYECDANGDALEMKCPPDLYWNDKLHVCDYPANAGCTLESLSVHKAAAPVADYVCIPYDDGSVPQYYPHESDCNRFYECDANGDALEMECPPDLHWNDKLHVCDYPANAGCKLESLSVHKVAAPVADYVCIPYDDGSVPQYYPHESDCNRFYECDANGDALEMKCPPDLYWNDKLHVCDYPANAGCTLESLSVHKAAAPVADYVCIPYDDGSVPQYYPHESDCNRFYECDANGDALEMECPPDLHWNDKLHVCDYPANAGCKN